MNAQIVIPKDLKALVTFFGLPSPKPNKTQYKTCLNPILGAKYKNLHYRKVFKVFDNQIYSGRLL